MIKWMCSHHKQPLIDHGMKGTVGDSNIRREVLVCGALHIVLQQPQCLMP